MWRRFSQLGSVPLLLARAAVAQEPTDSLLHPLPPWRLGAYVGVAVNSPGGSYLGVTTDRNHFLLGVRGVVPILRIGPVTVAYAADLVPIFIVWPNPTSTTAQSQGGDGPVWGVALAPLGLEGQVRVLRRLRFYAAGGVGIAQFTRPIPVVNSRAFNYTAEYGGGMLWEYRCGRWLQAGFKFHHLSNLHTAPENPGLDANLLYVGWHRLLGGACGRAA